MNAQRVFVIVLVVIAVLFVISIAAASSHGNQPLDNAGILSGLKGLRSSPLASFDAHDGASCASNPTTLTVSSSCTITLDKRGVFSRPIRVILRSQGPTDSIVQVQPNSGATQTATVKSGDCFETAVNHSGGTITISAAPGTTLALVGSC